MEGPHSEYKNTENNYSEYDTRNHFRIMSGLKDNHFRTMKNELINFRMQYDIQIEKLTKLQTDLRSEYLDPTGVKRDNIM